MAIKKRALKKLIIVALLLIGVELAFILFMSSGDKPTSFIAAMNNQIAANEKIPAERRSLVKIQLALNDFRVKHGKWPQKLEELTPEYFEAVPLDPQTAEPFKYRADQSRYYLGEPKQKPAGAGAGTGGKEDTLTQAEERELVASLDQKGEEESYIYDTGGKRDPFRSYDFSPQYRNVLGASPLTQFGYDELTLTAVLEGIGEPKAIVEDPTGKGYTVSVGTAVGNMGGKIVKMEKDKLVILETTTEFTGEQRTRTVEMYLR